MVKFETQIKNQAKAPKGYFNREGNKIVSVSQALGKVNKPPLIAWANRLGLQGKQLNEYLFVLAEVGKLAHLMMSDYCKGLTTNLDLYSKAQIDVADICYGKFSKWYHNNEIEVLDSELRLVSEIHQYGGTLDLYCILNGVYSVVDFKTGSGIYLEAKVQGSAYGELLREHGKPCQQIVVLNVGRGEKDATEECICPDDPRLFKAFLSAVKMYYNWKEIEGI